MSNLPGVSENEKLAGRKSSGKALERSNFAQTCSLLSQYLKEKGSFGDLSREMAGKLEAKEKPETFWPSAPTMNLPLPKMEKSGETSRQNGVAPNVKSMDFFPQTSFGSSEDHDTVSTKTDFSKPAATEPETAQMTIFYAGQVLVFNDFPANKANEIMVLASKRSSHNSSAVLSTSGQDKINATSFVAAGSSNIIVSTSGPNSTPERIQHQPQAIDSDLRIVRRASLHRFFEKRKDRVTARAPYQVNDSHSTPPKPEDGNSWLDLEAQPSKQLELKL
ncbi:hypothetical protein L1049_003630 [Liquidambar formosana]|uniref:Protein TIFY n=1 Tax=Liquidambar formosana TaxID=63359 RepID=A0AAP0RQF6_LIQFO